MKVRGWVNVYKESGLEGDPRALFSTRKAAQDFARRLEGATLVDTVLVEQSVAEAGAPRCGNCRFFEPNIKELGHCQRYPPQFATSGVDGNTDFSPYFPSVHADEWCGEFFEKGEP